MRETRPLPRLIAALAGVLVLLATVALAAVTARPTEATWQDTVQGAATFTGGVHPDEDLTFARHAGPFGQITRVDGGTGDLGSTPSTVDPSDSLSRVSENGWTQSEAGGFFKTVGESYNCARRDLPTSEHDTCAETGHEDSTAKSYAIAQVQNFRSRIWALLFPVRLVTLGEDTPTVATASCTPGSTGVATLDGGQLTLGSGLNAENFDLPAPGEYVDLDRDIVGYTYSGYLHHDYEVGKNYARSQLRLHLQASGDLTDLNPWTIHVVLAHAECGVRMAPTEPPRRPSETDPHGRVSERTALQQAGRAALHEETRSTDTSTTTERRPTATAEPEVTSPTTTASATSAPSTSEPTTTRPAPSSEPEPKVVETSAAPAGPQQPREVLLGQNVDVVTRDGIDLGTARVDDIERTPECGIELTLTITTSDEVGPGRWAATGSRDIHEVRADGATSAAYSASPECSAGPDSTPLAPGSAHRVVIAVRVNDAAERAMLRPPGTAGWTVDLPLLPA